MQKNINRACQGFSAAFVLGLVLALACVSPGIKSPDYNVACYYFPNYHPGDSRNIKQHGGPWSEWELVKHATPRFPGHNQPKVPLWGYEDESDPAAMAKIQARLSSGAEPKSVCSSGR